MKGLYKLQFELNSYINPNWVFERTKEDFLLAIHDELSELLNSVPWKWWYKVDKPLDIDNIETEFADILHFVLSLEMLTKPFTHLTLNKELVYEWGGDVNNIEYPDIGKKVKAVKEFVRTLIPYIEDSRYVMVYGNLFEKFHQSTGYPPHRLIFTFYKKIALNFARQDIDKRYGSYQKIWYDGREDNSIINEFDEVRELKRKVHGDLGADVYKEVMQLRKKIVEHYLNRVLTQEVVRS